MAQLTGHFDITTTGISRGGLPPLDGNYNSKIMDAFGRSYHPILDTWEYHSVHLNRGGCAEFEAISAYLFEIEKLHNIKIKSFEDAIPYTKGTKIQTIRFSDFTPMDPCGSDFRKGSHAGCFHLLNELGIFYVKEL